ncbi:prepilin-type N-terminal cleavage/methylation domain-containing protein [bacterium]|nr:prepilin-type N-terminal cleavage/methylation domain-containing protein [bacterium]
MVNLKKNSGVTLQELLIVITVIGFLAAILTMGYISQLKKGRDGRRRSDLEKIKLSFEDYFNDYGCYPTLEQLSVFENCGGDGFRPYLERIPCDPSGSPYKIIVEDSECPSWFAVYTNMEYLQDPDTKSNPCFSGCEVDEKSYNYAISSGNISPSEVAGASEGEGGEGCGSECFVLVEGECNHAKECHPPDQCFTNIPSCRELECCYSGCRVESCGGD